MATVHIIGAGISGLAAATALSQAHVPVKLYEASTHAGGRCRTTRDPKVGAIDSGLHLFSGAGRELWHFIDRIGSREAFQPVVMPWIVHDGQDHPLDTKHLPYLPLADAARLARYLAWPGDAALNAVLAEESPYFDQWLAPMARLALHRPAHGAAARQWRAAMLRQLRRGGTQWFMARESLQQSFLAPALAQLEYQGSSVYYGQPLKALELSDDHVRQLNFARQRVALDAQDVVIVATPAPVTGALLPMVATPPSQISSITLHYAIDHREPAGSVRVLANRAADLVRYDTDAIRTTIRLAEPSWHSDDAVLAAHVWRDLQRIHPYLPALPDWAIWREKRAGHRPLDRALPAPALPARLLLAGDWLDATRASSLNVAAASGHRAAAQAMTLIGKQLLRAQ